MIRRFRRTLPWFGAVAALLVLALPVQAQQTESDPFVEEELEPHDQRQTEAEIQVEEQEETDTAAEPGHNIEKFIDLAIVRPLYLARLIVGLPFFVVYPLTLGSGWSEDVVGLLWTDPYEATFKRPLGEAPGGL